VVLIKIDLTVNLRPIGVPAHRPLEPVVPIDWPVDWPEVLLYPIVDHTADKIAESAACPRGSRSVERTRASLDPLSRTWSTRTATRDECSTCTRRDDGSVIWVTMLNRGRDLYVLRVPPRTRSRSEL
jgi:hypothetical protein